MFPSEKSLFKSTNAVLYSTNQKWFLLSAN